MKARGMIDGIGDLAGLQSSTRHKVRLSEGADDAKRGNLSEEVKSVSPPILNESIYDAVPHYGGGYREKTTEEKLRHGVELIKQALCDEAFKGIGDDGKVMRDIAPGSPGPWRRVDKLLSKEVYPDRFKPLIQGAKAIIEEFME